MASTKKTTVKTTVLGGVIIDMRIKWSAETQEYAVNVKRTRDRLYNPATEYFTSDYKDAVATGERMVISYRESMA